MKNNKINVTMVGIGHAHAAGVLEELLTQTTVFHVTGFVESNTNILNQKRNTAPFNKVPLLTEEDVLNNKTYEIDAFLIETEMKDLISTARKYLRAGIPLHLDKPTGIDKNFLILLKEAKKLHVPIQMGYMYRYNPAVFIADKYIKENRIGDICYIHAFMDTELEIHQRKSLNCYPGGAMYVYGCHMLDIVLRFMGQPQSVRSFIKQSGFNSTEADDSTLTLLEYNRGASIVAASCVDANGYGRRQIVISGSKGTIEIKPLENPTKMTYAERDGKDEYKDKASYIDLSGYNFDRRYYYMITDFAYMIQRRFDKMIFQMDYEYEKKLHELLMQAINL